MSLNNISRILVSTITPDIKYSTDIYFLTVSYWGIKKKDKLHEDVFYETDIENRISSAITEVAVDCNVKR